MSNDNLDRLYELLPQHIRFRDAGQGYPLRALLQVIARQVNAVQEDIAQLYDNWFIETCQEWVVPYIGELIGYEPIETIGDAGVSRSPARDRILIPRREVANTIRYRSRKGTLPVLEELAHDLTGWVAAAVEFFGNAPVGDAHLSEYAETVRKAAGIKKESRDWELEPRLTQNQTNVALFVWRRHCYPVTLSTPHYVETKQAEFYTFSPLGNNTPLYRRQEQGDAPAGWRNLPIPITREMFKEDKTAYYGKDKSFCIYAPEEWPPESSRGGRPATPEPPREWQEIPVDYIIPGDLSVLRKKNRPFYPDAKEYEIVVDPELGRFIFPGGPRQRPRYELRGTYQASFHADLGGGEYQRPLSGHPEAQILRTACAGLNEKLNDAIGRLENGTEDHILIEITDSGLYLGRLPDIVLRRGQTLQIRAANRCRPVIWIEERSTGLPDSLRVLAYPTSCFILDGVLLAGRGLHVDEPQDQAYVLEQQPARVIIRHSTLVPGWFLLPDTSPVSSEEASIELNNVMTTLLIQRSIVGSISVAQEDAPKVDPSEIVIEDSILDSTAAKEPALYGEVKQPAYIALTVRRSTVLGEVEVRELPLAENSIFRDKLTVHNRQGGFIRYSAFPSGSKTPRHFGRQTSDGSAFVSVRYGTPDYCRLKDDANEDLRTKAEYGGEMGVYYHLFDPMRKAILQRRLEEYVPLGVKPQVFLCRESRSAWESTTAMPLPG